MSSFLIFVASALSLALAVFAHQPGHHQAVLGGPQRNHVTHTDDDDVIDISTNSKFYGLTTFANLPYVHCFDEAEKERYDIAIMGAPFDTVGSFYLYILLLPARLLFLSTVIGVS
jgi:hypothetical protein